MEALARSHEENVALEFSGSEIVELPTYFKKNAHVKQPDLYLRKVKSAPPPSSEEDFIFLQINPLLFFFINSQYTNF